MFWHLNREKGNLELSKTIGLNYRVWLNYIINVVILLSSSNVNNFIREIIYPLLTASIHSSSHELYFFIFIVILFFHFSPSILFQTVNFLFNICNVKYLNFLSVLLCSIILSVFFTLFIYLYIIYPFLFHCKYLEVRLKIMLSHEYLCLINK